MENQKERKAAMKLNKIFSAAAAAVIAASQLSAFSVFAEITAGDGDELSDGTFTYETVDGGYAIVDCESSAIITDIPTMRNGYAIVEIAEKAFVGCSYISEVNIPKSVKKIGAYAFAGCSALEKVTLPETLTEIPDGAFDGCTGLTEITIPDGVENVGMIAFANCSALESVNFPDTLVSIGANAFEACGSLKEVDIPSGVTEIGEMAFINCYSLEKITADNNSAFTVEGNVLYDADMTRIYRAAVTGIDEIFCVPSTVSIIMDGAFSYCTTLKTIVLSDKVTKIGQEAFFFCTGLEDIDFPAQGLVEIDASAFAHCTALTSLSFPTTLKTIGEGAFFDAANLERVMVSDGLTTIGDGAFAVCESLKNIVIPSSVTSIGEYALGYTLNSSGDGYAKLEGFSMSVNSGTAAEKYAKKNDIEHTVGDRSLKKIAFIIICIALLLAAAVFAVVLMRRGKKLAPADVRKAEAAEAEENDPDYEGIIGSEENKQ